MDITLGRILLPTHTPQPKHPHALLVFSVDELHGPEASVVNPCNSWFSSSLEDGSDHMELCVAMSGLIYHWLL